MTQATTITTETRPCSKRLNKYFTIFFHSSDMAGSQEPPPAILLFAVTDTGVSGQFLINRYRCILPYIQHNPEGRYPDMWTDHRSQGSIRIHRKHRSLLRNHSRCTILHNTSRRLLRSQQGLRLLFHREKPRWTVCKRLPGCCKPQERMHTAYQCRSGSLHQW